MSLQACIDFALENSYAVNQKILENELNIIQLKARKSSIAPSLGANIGQTFDFGRSEMPDNSTVSTTQATTSFGVGMNMDIFQGLRTHHQIQSDKLNLQATLFDIESAKENVELAVTAYYLQILLNAAILEIYKAQVELAQEQVARIELLVTNGKSSDAELYIAKSTLATDQVSVVEAINNVRLSILDLAQLMNFPDVANFDIDTESDYADIDKILDKNVDLNIVTENALQNRPAIQAVLARIEQAKRSVKISQAGWYPTLTFSASFGTGYYYIFREIAGFPNRSFGEHFKNNARESLGFSLYIPIFDKLSTHYNVKLQKVNIKMQKLQLEETKRKLIKEIEQEIGRASCRERV
jgi:outer membrane protein